MRAAQKSPPRRMSWLRARRRLDEQRNQLQKTESELPAQREQLERQQKLYDFTAGYRMVSEDQSTAIAAVKLSEKIRHERESAATDSGNKLG